MRKKEIMDGMYYFYHLVDYLIIYLVFFISYDKPVLSLVVIWWVLQVDLPGSRIICISALMLSVTPLRITICIVKPQLYLIKKVYC